jgi:nucleoside-diphosphate-sugar epimerase
MKIAVTGASGYVGGIIAAALRSHGHEVLSLSRRECRAPWSRYELGDDPDLLPWEGVDGIVHAAYDFTCQKWEDIRRHNVDSSVSLLRAAHNNGVKRIIHISSMSAFPECRSLYGKAKMLVEEEVLALGGTVIRPGLVWCDNATGMMGALEKAVRFFPVIPYPNGQGGLHQYLIHAEDLGSCVVNAIVCGGAPGIRLLAHPQMMAFPDILKTIAQRRGVLRLLIPVPWQLLMLPMRAVEACGIRLPFRCDSLIGLVHSNPTATVMLLENPENFRPYA